MAKVKMNVSVNYDEALFYVNYNNIYMFKDKNNPSKFVKGTEIPSGDEDKYEYDADMTQVMYDGIRKKITDYMTTHFNSMQAVQDEYLNKSKSRRVIARNTLFSVVIEDNVWSIAVELINNPKGNAGLQSQMFTSFANGLRNALFEQFDELYVRTGSYTADPITKDSPANYGNDRISLSDVCNDMAYAYEDAN